jgi:DNA-binding transcriptional MerR regulator
MVTPAVRPPLMTRGIYKARTITQLTGFSPTLLRAWEMRHHLLLPERSAGGQRLYTEEDLQVLRQVSILLETGRSIGELARLGRAALLSMPSASGRTEPTAAALPLPAWPFQDWMQRLLRGAVQLDRGLLETTLEEVFGQVPLDRIFTELLLPTARQVGELWSRGQCSVAGEHLLTACFMQHLQLVLKRRPAPRTHAPRALCACLPEELHSLGLLVVSYHLEEQGWQVTNLTAGLPFEDLEHAWNVLQPHLVCLSVARGLLLQLHRPRLLSLLQRQGSRTRFVLGGAGVPPTDPELEAAGAYLWPLDRPLQELGTLLPPPQPPLALPSP